MSLQLSALRQELLSDALNRVVELAESARDATCLDEAKRQLNAVWFAVHHAAETINDLDRETRREALNNIGEAA
jgi:hypothetical protein